MQKMCLNHGFSDKRFATQGTRYKRHRGGDCESTRGPSRGSTSQSGRRLPCLLELKTHPEDLGKVIGREGRTAKAIRTILGAAGVKLHKRVTLEILENSGRLNRSKALTSLELHAT